MTDKDTTSEFSIEKLKEVTDNHNDRMVKIPSSIYTYRSYYGMPSNLSWDDRDVNFEVIVNSLAYLMQNDILHLMKGAYERYWAYLMELDYHKMFNKPKNAFRERFQIVKATKIAVTMYKKDILYVFDNGDILIVKDMILSKKLRDIREIE